jgi:hypothetical protein
MTAISPHFSHGHAASGTDRRQGVRLFLRHAFEMTASMLIGMAVLGAAFRQIHVLAFGAGLDDLWHKHTELAVFGMTFNMTVPMVAWMRHRGHAWRRGGEMAATMFVLSLALLVLFWVGAISGHTVLPLEMALMLPAMILVMLRRFDEYAAHASAAAARRGTRGG